MRDPRSDCGSRARRRRSRKADRGGRSHSWRFGADCARPLLSISVFRATSRPLGGTCRRRTSTVLTRPEPIARALESTAWTRSSAADCRHRLYLIDGAPGTGKTTLALQFLLAGAAHGESGLYVTLSESREELGQVAESHGWSLDGIDVFELPVEDADDGERRGIHIFHPAEVELQVRDRPLFGAVEKSGRPARRARLALRDAPPRARPAPLPPSDPRAQAVLRRARLHRAPARRQDGARGRPAAAQPRARRRPARACRTRVRRGAAPTAGDEAARAPLPGRLPRFPHLHRRSRGVSAHRTPRRDSHEGDRPPLAERLARARRTARWWTAERYEPARHRAGGDGQVRPLHAVRVRRGDAW